MNDGDVFTSKLLNKYSNVVHGTSSRKYGDMIKAENVNRLFRKLSLNPSKAISMKQVHGSDIALIESSEHKRHVVDGLITGKNDLFLYALTADCLPILFYEPEKKIVSIVHAGYKGLFEGIVGKMIVAIKKLGGNTKELIVYIGPSIGACCYEVRKDRIYEFIKRFDYKNIYKKTNGTYFLDLKRIAFLNLIDSGVNKGNIEVSNICAFDEINLYSYRREQKTTARALTFIGMI